MKRNWLIIPDYKKLSESMMLCEKYDVAFEYNDFFLPNVYSDEEEVKKRIQAYKKLDRNRSEDTLHGVFLDISAASTDPVIWEYSQRKIEQSVCIAEELGVRGVIFHTGLIAELQISSYMEHWVEEQEKMWHRIMDKYPSIHIYMENTFEKTPNALIDLKKRLKTQERFQLCLDYGHACLTTTPIEEWVKHMAPYIGHIHLNDNDLHSDLHLVPGEGIIDFMNFKKLMTDYHIEVPVLLEISDVSKQSKALDYMNAL